MTEEMLVDGRARGDRHRPGHVRRPHDLAGAAVRRVSLREAAREAASRAARRDVADARSARSRDRGRDRRASSASRSQPACGAGKIATEIFERAVRGRRSIQPTFVYDFPTEVSPLSKQKPDDPDTVERFELYIGGFEVANAFSELNDPAEQRRRFEAQLADRAARRPRSARDGRGLHPRARVRPAADRRAKASASIGW